MTRGRLLAGVALLVTSLLGGALPAAADDPPTLPPVFAPTPTPAPTPKPTTGPVNVAPVAVDDPAASVQPGRTVRLDVLANDTDDGLGGPAGQPGHLVVAPLTDGLGHRLAPTADSTALSFTARADDAGRVFTVTYTAGDGSLTSNPAHVTVTVTAPPEVRAVTLTTARTLVALRRQSLRGTVSPAGPGPVTVTVQRGAGGRWTSYATARTDARGRYSVAVRTDRTGRWVLRAIATWRDGHRATSPQLTRTVVARLDASVSGPLTRAGVRWSYRAGCPVGPGGLRRITLDRRTYDGRVARGSLVVRAGAVAPLLRVFRSALAAGFPIRSMRPSDAYYDHGRRTPTESDLAAMRADNTSAFNCRPVTGNPYRISQHSYGNAIDINTVRNPYVVGSRVYPAFAGTYLRRSQVRAGMITPSGVVARTMRVNGWPWGARWAHPDYQHFSANGG